VSKKENGRLKIATTWAVISTIFTITLSVQTITGLPSCSEYAQAADLKETDARLASLIGTVQTLAVTVGRIDERTRTCE
jgi:hypothetical protein